jgi:hypothetical protein
MLLYLVWKQHRLNVNGINKSPEEGSKSVYRNIVCIEHVDSVHYNDLATVTDLRSAHIWLFQFSWIIYIHK